MWWKVIVLKYFSVCLISCLQGTEGICCGAVWLLILKYFFDLLPMDSWVNLYNHINHLINEQGLRTHWHKNGHLVSSPYSHLLRCTGGYGGLILNSEATMSRCINIYACINNMKTIYLINIFIFRYQIFRNYHTGHCNGYNTQPR